MALLSLLLHWPHRKYLLLCISSGFDNNATQRLHMNYWSLHCIFEDKLRKKSAHIQTNWFDFRHKAKHVHCPLLRFDISVLNIQFEMESQCVRIWIHDNWKMHLKRIISIWLEFNACLCVFFIEICKLKTNNASIRPDLHPSPYYNNSIHHMPSNQSFTNFVMDILCVEFYSRVFYSNFCHVQHGYRLLQIIIASEYCGCHKNLEILTGFLTANDWISVESNELFIHHFFTDFQKVK